MDVVDTLSQARFGERYRFTRKQKNQGKWGILLAAARFKWAWTTSPCRSHGRMERLGLSSANICAVSFYCYPFMQVCTGDCVRVRLTGNPNLGLPPRWSYIVKALKLDTKSLDDLLGIFLAILSWKTVVDAGLPLWCNDSDMILPGDKAVWVKKVLHNSLTLRGRCPLAILVYEIDESNNRNESKSNSTIPGSVSKCSLRHSRRVQS